jgi:hypothetical protein
MTVAKADVGHIRCFWTKDGVVGIETGDNDCQQQNDRQQA